MAMLICPECNNNVSDMADFCPQCGCKIEYIRQNQKNVIKSNPKDFRIENGKLKRYDGDANFIVIPNSVKQIEQSVFPSKSLSDRHNYSITHITIPASVENISDGAFSYCCNLIDITVDKKNENYCSVDGVLFDKNMTTIIRYPADKKGTYELPSSVTDIEGSAFRDCKYLSSIKISNNVKYISTWAFLDCCALESVVIPDSVETISFKAFKDCENLKSLIIKGKPEIGPAAFENCKALEHIEIPNGITSLGVDAFLGTAYYNNKNNWENNVLYIGQYLIKASDSLSGEYYIKDGTSLICPNTFIDCKKLKKVIIPESVTTIGLAAFNRFEGTSIIIPESVTSIENDAFNLCKNLKSIEFPNGIVKLASGAFTCCESLTSVTIPEGVVDIGSWTFAGCKKLMKIVIPDSVTNIGERTFSSCEDLVIFCNENSYAQRYAMDNNIPCSTNTRLYAKSEDNCLYGEDIWWDDDGSNSDIYDYDEDGTPLDELFDN